MPISTIGQKGLEQAQIITPVQMPAGSVVQVVTATYSSVANTSSTTYVTTGFSVTISPKLVTSKILFTTSAPMSTTTGNASYVTVYRNSTTNLSPNNALNVIYVAGVAVLVPCALNVTDSPSTTAATTYTVYFKVSGGGAISYGDSSSGMTLTVMEVAA